MVLIFVLLIFPAKNTRSKVFLILLIWLGSIRTKQYLAGLSLHCLLWLSPLFMALRLLVLLGKSLVHVLLCHPFLIFLLSSKCYSLYSKAESCQKFLDDSDLILSVLNGLNSSFHSFVTTYMLFSKEKSMPFFNFHVELLNYDFVQQFHSQSLHSEAGFYALYSHKPGSKTSSCHNNNKSRFSRVSKGSGSASSQFRQPLPHLPCTSSIAPSDSRSRSPCQICKQKGHQALDCFNHMNYSF